jgi:phage terminase large subunit-like protein
MASATKRQRRACSPDAPLCGFTFDGRSCRGRGEHRCHRRVEHVLAFFRELLVHTKGPFARRPFVPTRWQVERVLAPLFGDVRFDEHWLCYVRRYRVLYLLIPRKNGKTELLAGIVLYLLCADGEEQGEVYGLALDRDQAGHVYRAASRMVDLSPVLSRRLQVIRSTSSIIDPASASFYRVTAGDASGTLGANPHGGYIDELLTQPNRDLFDALRTSLGTRTQPLLMLATTADADPNGFAASERAWSERVRDQPDLEASRLVVIYAASPDADWTDERVWRECNPALGDFLDVRTLRDEHAKAIANPAEERAFRQFRLNQSVRVEGRAIDLRAWDACGVDVERFDESSLAARLCFAGLDLAASQDLASIALDFPSEDGSHDVIWRHFAPADRLADLDRRTAGQASVWAADGTLTITEGNVIDYRAILAAVEQDAERFDVREIAYDRWGMTQLSQDLTDAGAQVVQFGQGFNAMSPPTRELLRLVAAGGYRHHGNALARWEASNLIVRSDPAGNVKPDKARSADKIDGIVAAVMALDRATRHVATPSRSSYRVAGF